MKKFFLAFALCTTFVLILSGCSSVAPVVTPTPTNYVLVHGSWQGPFVWESVAATLKSQGHKVEVVELPAHGKDRTPAAQVTMNSYRDKVIQTMNSLSGKVVLVGHSLGGYVNTSVAEQVPDKISKLVYLAGYIPTSGQSLLDITLLDTEARVFPSLVPAPDGLTLNVKREDIISIFCQDCSTENGQKLLAEYREEPSIPSSNPVTLTPQKFGNVAKAYIFTTQDRAVGPKLQQKMVSDASITEVYNLTSGHTAQLSVPNQVSDILLRFK
jgi:pimeloyl-ACP methyl ester carboxylesterase